MRGIRLRRPRERAPAPLICRWDLDKTYLRSEFDSLRQLLRTAFERAEDKVDVPGVAELIKALRQASERLGRPVRTYFISASPPQIGSAIRAKLALDGVPYDGIVFKDQLRHIRRGQFRSLREHVGFKLAELLRGRLEAPPEARELLFGDDWESDPLIYSLYADAIGSRLETRRLASLLRRVGVDAELTDRVLGLAARAAGRDAVVRIFINLERRTPPSVFQLFGPRVVPTFNYFQTAAVLEALGLLAPADVVRVARALTEGASYTPRRLANSLDDLVRRGLVSPGATRTLVARLAAEGVLGPSVAGPRWRRALAALGRLPGRRRRGALAAPPPQRPAPLDYDAILDQLRPRVRGAALWEAP
jgi:hypothetical protein